LVEAGEDEEVIIADLDLDSVREARVDLLFWRDRRPDTYDALVAP
jgi:beta-ureidopropionase